MSGNQAWAYAAGAVVGIALAVFTGGTALAAYSTLIGTVGFSVTAAGVSYALADKGKRTQVGGAFSSGGQSLSSSSGGTGRDAAAQQLQIASASEAVVIPVVFGKVRIAGNIVRYDKATFRSEPIIERRVVSVGQAPSDEQLYDAYRQEEYNRLSQEASGGGKGGGGGEVSQSTADRRARERVKEYNESGARAEAERTEYEDVIIGYRYFLSYDYALCMGPVDEIKSIRSDPGETLLYGEAAFGIGEEFLEIAASGIEEGGDLVLYRGTGTQSREADSHYTEETGNYRHVCFAHFHDYQIGTSPAPKTTLFEIVRRPNPVFDNGTASGIQPTGGATDTQDETANPAAVIWEVLQNKVWGKGISSDLLHVASFIEAGQYYYDQGVGLSFKLDSQQTLETILDSIRMHVDCAIIWDGQKLRMRVLSDTESAFTPLITIDSDQVTDVQISRPAWNKSTNEIKAEFTNAENNYQPELVAIQNDASVAIIGQINSQNLGLKAFGDRPNAMRAAARLLREASNPPAVMTFKMNRMDSRLLPGGGFQFRWSDWTDGDLITYWRVAQISDENQDSEGFDVRSTEAPLAAYESETLLDFQLPANINELYQPPSEADVSLAPDNAVPVPAGAFGPAYLRELNIFLTGGQPEFCLFCDRENSLNQGLVVEFQRAVDAQFFSLGAIPNFAITGTLKTPVAAGTRDICRQAGDAFEILLDYPGARNAEVLASASKCAIASDSLSDVTIGNTDLLLIGNEIIAVGNTELSGDNIVVSNYLRSYFGTSREAHATDVPVVFIPAWAHDQRAISSASFAENGSDIDFKFYLATNYGVDYTTSADLTAPFYGLGRRPFAPSIYSTNELASTTEVNVRPRFHDRGWGIRSDVDLTLAETNSTGMGDYSILYQGRDGLGDPVGDVLELPGAYVTDDPNDPATGLYAGTAPHVPGATEIWIFQGYKGSLSADSVKIANPPAP